MESQRRKSSSPTASTVSGTSTGEIRKVVIQSLPGKR